MYKRILVPVDGSRFSEQLIASAAQLARATGTPLALLRVVERADEQAEATRYLQALAAPTGAESLCRQAGTDGVAAAIGDEARRVTGTLVAMCSHGRSGAMQALFGSVALQVLRALGEPLVMYRPHTDTTTTLPKIARIVLPLDGSKLSEAVVPQAAALAKWLGAKVIVVSVIEPSVQIDSSVPSGDVMESSYVRTRAREIAERHDVPVGWEVLHGEPKQAIPQFARSLGDAMLAMTTHGHTGLRGVVTGSVTAQCLHDAQVPVFIRLP
ncbi:MAG: universal stress protein [Ideonella sp.]|nr:universal stress protein [Ideonella sp.]MCC7455336.1 universal stress protein [Nitrospira sp.]